MCAEFWVGCFDHWGAHHHTTSAWQAAQELEDLLAAGASVNIYMFHGGTNFGFTNGADDKGVYQPTVTSYDYDSPLDEPGHPTGKYWAFREILGRYTDLDGRGVPAERKAARVLELPLAQELSPWDYFDTAADWADAEEPGSTDAIGHYSEFSVYRTEDQGRVNYGPRLGEPKGLIGPARLNGVPLKKWQLPPHQLVDGGPVLRAFDGLPRQQLEQLAGPVFARATFEHPDGSDLHLDTHNWTKGLVWVNGFCLGRYWARGPQRTLYVPGTLLKPAGNENVGLELHPATRATVSFVAEHHLGIRSSR